MSVAKSVPDDIFDLIGKSELSFIWLRGLHDTMSFVLMALAAGHIFAALGHHFWLKNDVLLRMLPFGKMRRLP